MKRAFDIIASLSALIILAPVFILLSCLIILGSGFPVFYSQIRVGRNNNDFTLLKFRTMKKGSERKGLLTVGEHDSRITGIGSFLRKYKLDELPQLYNVLIGDMSMVGPRPEVRKYVALYNEEQMKVLTVPPGITDNASIEYSEENKLLAEKQDPEKFYIEVVMPAKLKLNLQYVSDHSLAGDIKIILKTVMKIFS